jgi:hypothetical protein
MHRVGLLVFGAVMLRAQDPWILHVDRGFAEPIARLDLGAGKLIFRQLYNSLGETTDDGLRRFDSFISSKPTANLYSGGQRVGSTQLTQGHDQSCAIFSAKVVKSNPTARLAVSGEILIATHASTRRRASPSEAATLRHLIYSVFRESGVEEQLLPRIKASSILSTELRRHAGRAIIGNFELKTSVVIYDLLAIAEPSSSGYKLIVADMNRAKDVVEETDRRYHTFVDQIDLEGDGSDEIVTQNWNHNGWDYLVWRFDGARWQMVFLGSGGDCYYGLE